MRPILLPFAVLASACALGQTAPTPAEDAITTAHRQLSTYENLSMILDGTDRVGDVVTRIRVEGYFSGRRDGPAPKLNLAFYEMGPTETAWRKTYEIVGDGRSIWTYNGSRREYSAAVYSRPGTPAGNEAARNAALFGADKSAFGPGAYISRLMRELFSGPEARYRNWMPARTPYQLPVAPPTQDPVVPADIRPPYQPTAEEEYYLYDGSPRRSMVMVRRQDSTDPDVPVWYLSSVKFGERSTLRGQPRLVEWSMNIQTAADLTNARFTAYAPGEIAGYRAVVAPRPVKN